MTLNLDGWPWERVGPSKLLASFHSHLWIWTGVIIQKCWNPGQICDFFFAYVALKLDGWSLIWQFYGLCDLEIGRLCNICVIFCSHLWIQMEVMTKICFDLCDLDPWFLTLTFCMYITYVNGNGKVVTERHDKLHCLYGRYDGYKKFTSFYQKSRANIDNTKSRCYLIMIYSEKGVAEWSIFSSKKYQLLT